MFVMVSIMLEATDESRFDRVSVIPEIAEVIVSAIELNISDSVCIDDETTSIIV